MEKLQIPPERGVLNFLLVADPEKLGVFVKFRLSTGVEEVVPIPVLLALSLISPLRDRPHGVRDIPAERRWNAPQPTWSESAENVGDPARKIELVHFTNGVGWRIEFIDDHRREYVFAHFVADRLADHLAEALASHIPAQSSRN